MPGSNRRGWIVLPVCALLGAAALCSVARPAFAGEAVPPRTISVTGQGEVTVAPDLARLTLAIETRAPKAAEAVADNARLSTKVTAALKKLLGADDKLSTAGYALEPRYEPVKPGELGERRVIGYLARNVIQVSSHKIGGVGSLIDVAVAAGANRVSSLQFTLADRNAALRLALAKAGAEAQAQAEAVAKALGVKLKGVASAVTSAAPIVPPRYFEGGGFAAMAARAPTAVEPGEVSVSATLQVKYDID
jgi:uncharacterized protein